MTLPRGSRKFGYVLAGLAFLLIGHRIGLPYEVLALGAGLCGSGALAQGVADHGQGRKG